MRNRRTIERYVAGGLAYRRWYVQARLVVAKLAETVGASVGRTSDILALTSPRCSVTRNLRVTYAYLDGGIIPVDVVRSTRVALGHYELTGEIRGPKTGAFAKALRGDDTSLVVDSHVARAFGFEAKVARSAYVIRAIRRIVERISASRGLTIVETQASLWAGYYREAYPTGKVPLYRWGSIVPF